jgi:hypothetical protein
MLDGDHALSQFEAEAFFDRLDVDAQTITQKLLPLPSQTVLQQHVWDAPSATYFRHRFTLRSRYAGALRSIQNQEAYAWVTDPNKIEWQAEGWTMRVALRADLSRMLLTRPQLRALIPLTTSPSGDEARRPAPPILGVLQEPPFARGGLADRVAAEIKTGFGYGFPATDPKNPPPTEPPVEIQDSRKEIGPSPFLDYLPLNAAAALGTALMAEGPLGLTFDQVDASGAAFPNSMISLSPLAVAGDNITMEEHFVGVSMRRYIDPAWTIEETFKPNGIPAARCCWIEFSLPKTKSTLLTFVVDKNHQPLILIDEAPDKTGILSIQTTKLAVDGVPGFDQQEVEIAQLASDFTDQIVILHQPVAPNRYSTSVLALPKSEWASTERGRSNSYLLLASFEWSPPKDTKDQAAKAVPAVTLIASKECVGAKATMASTPTALAWTKTSRDFDFVHTARVDDERAQIKLDAARVTDLVARREDDQTITFEQSGQGPVQLCSSTLLNKFPVHLHRHLSVLTTRYLSGPGRPIEEFCRSAVLMGTGAVLLPSGSPPVENNVRII